MAKVTKAQVLKLTEKAKSCASLHNTSYVEELEYILLKFDNVYKNTFGSVNIILKGGNHVDLMDII